LDTISDGSQRRPRKCWNEDITQHVETNSTEKAKNRQQWQEMGGGLYPTVAGNGEGYNQQWQEMGRAISSNGALKAVHDNVFMDDHS